MNNDIVNISDNAKERFCKDCNIPIRLFKEPYFSERLQLYNFFFQTIEKWKIFCEELKKYKNEQDYFEEYNRVKEKAINQIKNSEEFQQFNAEDMNKFKIVNLGFPAKDIFKPSNNERTFISIDMRQANFSSLYHYNQKIFCSINSWEEFLHLFTENLHIRKSKYIRQVILGNCNPKRHISYEKYLMDQVLTELLKKIDKNKVVYFSNDEIIIDLTTAKDTLEFQDICGHVLDTIKIVEIPLTIELFLLFYIPEINGYKKEFLEYPQISIGKQVEFKCIDSYMYPFILRRYLGEEITENDKVFYYEGKLAKFIEVPQIDKIN